MKKLFTILIFWGCSEPQPKYNLKVTDSIIYWDTMELTNESP